MPCPDFSHLLTGHPICNFTAVWGRKKELPDLMHQNQIFCETFQKELQCQQLHMEYRVNSLKWVHTITRKPMS
uniref:Uncharacterized protein n=1 Tax=Chrysemys picta bellii TaxID=8478 RepID=A0A8C3I836_CHRPI